MVPELNDHLSMDYAEDRYFYRVYSSTSIGALRSGRYYHGHPALSENDLLDEFALHRRRNNRRPTAVVSVTNRPLEALHRALEKRYLFDEDPGTIWIVINRVPNDGDNCGPHHAQSLAETKKYSDAQVFEHEYQTKWEIPQDYVKHRVSVKTLLSRGIERIIDLYFPEFRMTQNEFIKEIANSEDFYGAGRLIGTLAQIFGTGEYTADIASRILQDCLDVGHLDEDAQNVHFHTIRLCRGVDLTYIHYIDQGIDDQLDAGNRWLEY